LFTFCFHHHLIKYLWQFIFNSETNGFINGKSNFIDEGPLDIIDYSEEHISSHLNFQVIFINVERSSGNCKLWNSIAVWKSLCFEAYSHHEA
jgi:hypothetical protein